MKLDREKVQVEVDGIIPYANKKFSGIKIIWSGSIGFGEYEIYTTPDHKEAMYEGCSKENQRYMYTKWNGQSEYMDSNDDKWFIKLLMESLIEKMEIDK